MNICNVYIFQFIVLFNMNEHNIFLDHQLKWYVHNLYTSKMIQTLYYSIIWYAWSWSIKARNTYSLKLFHNIYLFSIVCHLDQQGNICIIHTQQNVAFPFWQFWHILSTRELYMKKCIQQTFHYEKGIKILHVHTWLSVFYYQRNMFPWKIFIWNYLPEYAHKTAGKVHIQS